MSIPKPTKTREWKDGNTPSTGTPALGSNFDDEFNQLYENDNYLNDNKFDKNGGTINGNVVISGNLQVQGETVSIETTVLQVEDKVITININEIGPGVSGDGISGIEVDRGNGQAKAVIQYDESVDKWKAGLAGSEIPIALQSDVDALILIAESHTFNGVIHCINSCKVDSNGLPNFANESGGKITIDGATKPLRFNIGNGFSTTYGRQAFACSILSSIADAWDLSGQPDGTYYLYIEYNPTTKTFTYGFIKDYYQQFAEVLPSSAEIGQAVYIIHENKIYVWNGTAWEQKYRIYPMQIVKSGSSYTIKHYALNGRYISPEYSLTINSDINSNHNIGCFPRKTKAFLRCISSEYGFSVDDITEQFDSDASGWGLGGINLVSRLSITYRTGSAGTGVLVLNRTTGVFAQATLSNWKIYFLVDRGF